MDKIGLVTTPLVWLHSISDGGPLVMIMIMSPSDQS